MLYVELCRVGDESNSRGESLAWTLTSNENSSLQFTLITHATGDAHIMEDMSRRSVLAGGKDIERSESKGATGWHNLIWDSV